MFFILSLLFLLVSPFKLHTNENKEYAKRQAILQQKREDKRRFHPFYLQQGKFHRFSLKDPIHHKVSPRSKLLRTLTQLSTNPEIVNMEAYLALLNSLGPADNGATSLHPHVMINYNITPNGYKEASLAFFIHTCPTLNPDTKNHLLDKLGGMEYLQECGGYRRKIYGRSGKLLSSHSVTLK